MFRRDPAFRKTNRRGSAQSDRRRTATSGLPTDDEVSRLSTSRREFSARVRGYPERRGIERRPRPTNHCSSRLNRAKLVVDTAAQCIEEATKNERRVLLRVKRGEGGEKIRRLRNVVSGFLSLSLSLVFALLSIERVIWRSRLSPFPLLHALSFTFSLFLPLSLPLTLLSFSRFLSTSAHFCQVSSPSSTTSPFPFPRNFFTTSTDERRAVINTTGAWRARITGTSAAGSPISVRATRDDDEAVTRTGTSATTATIRRRRRRRCCLPRDASVRPALVPSLS